MGTESGDINVKVAAVVGVFGEGEILSRCSKGLLAIGLGEGRFLESGFLMGVFFGNGCESIHCAI